MSNICTATLFLNFIFYFYENELWPLKKEESLISCKSGSKDKMPSILEKVVLACELLCIVVCGNIC